MALELTLNPKTRAPRSAATSKPVKNQARPTSTADVQDTLAWDQPVSARPKNVEEVIARLRALQADLLKKQDPRVIFVTTYLIQTENTAKALNNPKYFENPEFIRQIDTKFAQYFFESFDAYERGDMLHCSEPWRRVFDMAKSKNTLTVEQIFLSIDVHINYDLPRALADIGATTPAEKRDYDRYNKLFADNIDSAKQQIMGIYTKKIGPLQPLSFGDKLLGWLDTPLSLKWIYKMRDKAWERSQALEKGDRATFAEMRRDTMKYIEPVECVSDNFIHRFIAKLRWF